MPFNFQITFNDGPTGAGDSPQLSGRISGMVITNNSGESIGYSSDSGSSFATLTAGSSVTLGAGDPTSFRFRRVNSGSYPLAVDAVVTMSVPMSEGYFDTNPVPGLVVNDATLATATANTAAINTALLTGARFGAKVTINNPGIIWVNGSIVLQNDTSVEICAGCTIKRVSGTDVPVFKNVGYSYLISAEQLTKSASTIVNVNDKNHTRSVGEKVQISNCPNAGYNGVVTVISVTQNAWTFDSGVSATGAAGSIGYFAFIIPVVSSILATNVSADAVTATVTITNASPAVVSWTDHKFMPRDKVVFSTTGALPTGLTAGQIYYVVRGSSLTANSFQVSATPGGVAINTSSAGSGTHTGAYSFVTVLDSGTSMRPGMRLHVAPFDGGDASYGGTIEVIKVFQSSGSSPADSWMFKSVPTANPIGELGLNYARDIKLHGQGAIDGNRNGVGVITQQANTVSFSMTNNLTVSGGLRITSSNIHSLGFYSCRGVTLDNLTLEDSRVQIQFEGSASDISISNLIGSGHQYMTLPQRSDDFLAFTGTAYLGLGPAAIYDVSVSPFGLGDFERIFVDNVKVVNSLNGIKLLAHRSCVFRKTRLRNIQGVNNDPAPWSKVSAGIFMGLDTAGDTGGQVVFSGGVMEDVEVDGVSWKSAENGSSCNAVIISSPANHGKIVLRRIDDDLSQAAAVYIGVGVGSIQRLEMLDLSWLKINPTNKHQFYHHSGTINMVLAQGDFLLSGDAGESIFHSVGNSPCPIIEQFVLLNSTYSCSAANTGHLLTINGRVKNVHMINVRPLSVTGYGANRIILNYPNANAQAVANYATEGLTVLYDGCHLRANNALSDGNNTLGVTVINIYAAATIWDSTGGGKFVDLGGASATPCAIYAGTDCKISSNALNTSSAALYSLFAPTLKAAVNAGTAGTTIARTAGATFFNTAAAGTLVANNVVMCDATGAANSWKQLTAPANAY